MESWTKIRLIPIMILFVLSINIILASENFIMITKDQKIAAHKEQKEIIKDIQNLVPKGGKIFAENQFVAFYFLADREPLTKFLYLTEINKRDGSQELTKKEIEKEKPYILWPSDPNQSYAKDIQSYIIKNYRVKEVFPKNGLVIYESK